MNALRRALCLTFTAAAFAAPAMAAELSGQAGDLHRSLCAGSATDQLARVLGQSITAGTKQAVIVDDRAGASGMLAAQNVAKSAADGYTVLITTNTTHAADEHLFKKLPYDPVKDFEPVTGLGKGGQVLVVRTDGPYKSVAGIARRRHAPNQGN